MVNKPLEKRYKKSIAFLNKYSSNGEKILDLGIENDLSRFLKDEGLDIVNTEGQDLDISPESVTQFQGIEIVTAFEILEHLVSPFTLLKALPANKLIATVPLRLWFAPAYKNINDDWDRHFHEFEDWQFDWLLRKAGWKIIATEKWTSPSKKIGLRPFLRKITPRYYAVYAIRS